MGVKKENELKNDEAKSLDNLSEQEINGKKVKGGGISVNFTRFLEFGGKTTEGS